MGDRIIFATLEQASIFENELKGQISDGHWENYAGSNYRTWCNARVLYSDDDEQQGRSFFVSCNLGFGSKGLFDIVGDRMRDYALNARLADQLGIANPVEAAERITNVLSYCDEKPRFRGTPDYIRNGGGYVETRAIISALYRIGVPQVLTVASKLAIEYTTADCRRDTRHISRIAKLSPY